MNRHWARGLVLVLIPVLMLVSASMPAAAGDKWVMTEPEYKVGDYWEYEVDDSGTTYDQKYSVEEVGSGKVKISIEAEYDVGGDHYDIDGEQIRDASNLALMEETLSIAVTGGNPSMTEKRTTYDPPLEMYNWDLGDKEDWSSDTKISVEEDVDGNKTSDSSNENFKFELQDYEELSIEGHDVKTIKYKMKVNDYERTMWYSAEVGNLIREEDSSGVKKVLSGHSCQEPGEVKDQGGGGDFNIMAMGTMCLALPIIGGVIIGVVFGVIIGQSSGYKSEIPEVKVKARKKGRSSGKGPMFCPRHGLRTELKNGVVWCHECEASPKKSFKYCPRHGMKLRRVGGVPVCDECGGEVKW
jgi:hypothetical protein